MRRTLAFLALLSGLSLVNDAFPDVPVRIKFAQEAGSYPVFENDKLPPTLYASRRNQIKRLLGPSGVAILFTNPERNRNNDDDFRFRPDSNFWYLTGFEEPDSILVLAPGGIELDGKRVTEVLLVNVSDQSSETWEGYRMGPAGAMRLLGFELALPNARFGEVLTALERTPKRKLSEPLIPPDPSGPMVEWINAVAKWKSHAAAGGLGLAAELAKMRVKKSPEELALMRKAAAISAQAHIEAMKAARPEMREYEIQALVEYWFARKGCESVAYNSIVGSGPNSTILHYEADRRLMHAGEIVCMDVAGEYHGYAADITRSYPVSGKYSKEQRAIYEVVLAAQSAGIGKCQVGEPFDSPHYAAVKVLGDGLLRLGVIKNRDDLARYFMHGTSHYLGLDVHDAHGSDTLQDSEVLTVEPGIYIKAGSPCDKKWWNIGIRIEDDILVTSHGPEILSEAAPRDPDKIEALMRPSK